MRSLELRIGKSGKYLIGEKGEKTRDHGEERYEGRTEKKVSKGGGGDIWEGERIKNQEVLSIE